MEANTLGLEGEFSVSCKHVTFSGELPNPSETLTVTPTYTECTVIGVKATVETNGCQYVFKGTEKTSENHFKGTQSISCPTEKSIVVSTTVPQCEAKIGSQSGLSSVSYISELGASPPNVKVEENLSSIHYTVTKDEGFLCPFSGLGEKTNGTLKGPSTLRASFGAESVGLAIVEAAATRLCSAAPVGGACPAGKSLMGGDAITGVSQTPAQLSTYFEITEAGVKKKVVECPQSNFSAKTKEEVNNPLPIENISITFGPKCLTNPGKTACGTVEMSNKPTTGTLNASEKLKPGNGIFTFPLTVKINCAGEIENCEYKTTAVEMAMKGGNAPGATIFWTGQPLANPKMNKGEKECWNGVRIHGEYEVTAPKPVWVTN
ncbi:MAG TPA: hypothetical protein VFP21_00280 [Solirubrobacterales bacterium]|nr:hypothetical protein [Solirubrobacterales bacterium]